MTQSVVRNPRPQLWEPVVVMVSAAYAIIFTWPASVQPAAWVWGSHGDGLGNIVEFSWFLQAIKDKLPWAVDPFLGIPFGEALGGQPHEPLYFWSQIGIGLVAGPVVALNVLSLIALPAAAWAMYRLVLWLTRSPVAAFVSGIGFGCSFYVIANTGGEPTLAQVWVFPAVILATLKLLERPSLTHVIATASVVTIASMVNFYYVLFIALSAAALGGTWLVFTTLQKRRFPVRQLLAGLSAGLLAVVITVVVYQFAVGHLAEQATRLHRTPATLSALAASPVDVLLPPRTNPWFGGWRQAVFNLRLLKHPGVFTDFSELTIAAPILVLALAGLAIIAVPRWRLRDSVYVNRIGVVAIAAVALLGVWLLVPPFGRRYGLTFLSLEWDIWSVAPSYASFYRAGLLLVLGACVMAGVAMAVLAARYPRVAATVALIAALGILIENFTWPADRVLSLQTPPEYAWINQHPGSYSIADYPMLPPGSGANEYTAEFNQRFHGHPLLNGAIGGTPGESMREEMRDPNRPGVASAMATLGVRYVIWHPDVIRQFRPLNPAYADLILGYQPADTDYRQVATFDDGSTIYAVDAAPSREFAFYAFGFGPVTTGTTGAWGRHATSDAGQIDLYSTGSATGSIKLGMTCSASETDSDLTIAGRQFGLAAGQPTSITVDVTADRGVTKVPVSMSPAAAATGITCTLITVSASA